MQKLVKLLSVFALMSSSLAIGSTISNAKPESPVVHSFQTPNRNFIPVVPVPPGSNKKCHHSRSKTHDNFFGIARLKLNPVLCSEHSAWSYLGEVGPYNYRTNATWGSACDCHRFKIGCEYLAQKIHYNFSSGKVHRWAHQWALGGKYQYLIDCAWLKGIQLSSYFSQARGHKLHSLHCRNQNFILNRRLAGADYFNVEAGCLLSPWECGTVSVGVGYDSFRYNRKLDHKKRLRGVGVCLDFTQRIRRDLYMDIKAEFRRAYNFLEGCLNWKKCTCYGDLTAGVFAGYTWGKVRLPCSTVFGVELGLSYGIQGCQCIPVDCCYDGCQGCDVEDLARWVSDTAVYIPQVLEISEQSKTRVETINTPG